ncbi:hypothetical protein P7K49_030977 [Saguinus oedipus]|uniref:Uncharacterized protein n=1 Tax=Saguinus oedipus TaxID=9490 RepID=A0ABQ9U3P8_SAGOE|nr:hypothetical protein P7K49_030977 [Saguinus oedipus]
MPTAFRNRALGSSWLGGERRSPLQKLYDLDQEEPGHIPTKPLDPVLQQWHRRLQMWLPKAGLMPWHILGLPARKEEDGQVAGWPTFPATRNVLDYLEAESRPWLWAPGQPPLAPCGARLLRSVLMVETGSPRCSQTPMAWLKLAALPR